MNKSEVKLLLADVAAIDNRRVSEETVTAWHSVIGHLSLHVAQKAHVMARQDEKVDYLEPRHIVSRSRDAIIAMNSSKPSEEEKNWRSDPVPVCMPHGELITSCKPCIAVLVKNTDGMSIEGRGRWADQNIGFREVTADDVVST